MRSALADMGRIGPASLNVLAGNKRDADSQRATVLSRHLRAESLSADQLTELAVKQGIASRERVQEIVAGAEPTAERLSARRCLERTVARWLSASRLLPGSRRTL